MRFALSALLLLAACLASGTALADARADSEAERKVIASLAPHAKRAGKTLTLRLTSGQELKLNSIDACAGPENCLVYRLLGLSPNQKFFVVEVRGYEAATLLWIGRNSGERYEVYAKPVVSPDGKWMVTANPVESGGNNGVFIWEIKEDQLIERLRHEPKVYALYSFVSWAGADKLVLKKFTNADKAICGEKPFMETRANLTLEGDEWKFDELSGLKEANCG